MSYKAFMTKIDDADIVELSGGGQTMRIIPSVGANWIEWHVDGVNMFMESTIEQAACRYGAPILFPTPNRVKDARYNWNNKTIKQNKNGMPRVLHGLVFDEVFTVTELISDNSYCAVDLELEINDGEMLKAFPFPCKLKITYRLSLSGPMVTYCVSNTGNNDLPFGFAIHPYFAKLDQPYSTFIQMPAPYVHEADEDKFPSGMVFEVKDTKYDLRKPVPCSELDLDHVYWGVEEGMESRLEYRESKRAITLTASGDFDHMVVYTPPYAGCICIEPQTCSTDAHNRHNAGFKESAHVIMVKPGERYEGSIRLTHEYL